MIELCAHNMPTINSLRLNKEHNWEDRCDHSIFKHFVQVHIVNYVSLYWMIPIFMKLFLGHFGGCQEVKPGNIISYCTLKKSSHHNVSPHSTITKHCNNERSKLGSKNV